MTDQISLTRINHPDIHLVQSQTLLYSRLLDSPRSASPEVWRNPPILEINIAEQLALNTTEGLYQAFCAGGILA